jgi:hypothetical protein
MIIPTFFKQNFAMHLLGSCFVELFPNLQLLDLKVFPDRFSIDFSFSRTLSSEEFSMVRGRFFEKISRNQKGDIREMVSKNACDLLKHYKQIFLTDLVNREEMFTTMLCMDLYNAPLFGLIDQDLSSIKQIHLEMQDHGEKKWMGKKVHHYTMDGFIFHSGNDLQNYLKLTNSLNKMDHREIGKRENLFWIEDGIISFSQKGEKLIQEQISSITSTFGDLVYFEEQPEVFQKLVKIDSFTRYAEEEGCYQGICYGLKSTQNIRSINLYDFSKKYLIEKLIQFFKKIEIEIKIDEKGDFVTIDYRGITWEIVKIFKEEKYLYGQVNILCLFAISLENNFK